jgi:asparagine synthase (glutamine-hydrolysing)
LSAFAVLCQFSDPNTPGFSGVFDGVMERLSHRGSDGSNTISTDYAMMGYWHFWTTPEEVGEYQPLKLSDLPFRIVFDGRIDNRDELFAMLGISGASGKSLSDAALALHAYARWGEDCFKKFVGEFALVIFDEQRNEIVAARDHLGDRTLFYAFFGTQLVIASEPWAVAGAGPSKPAINEGTVAHYFAIKVPQDGQTFFENVFELLPAHILRVSATDRRLWRYWAPDLYKKIRYKSDEEYAEHFLSLLAESVRSRMRSPFPVGILMSGGLDSTSVACLAARMIVPKTLTTISYVFDELSECDERQYIESVKEKYGIHSIQIPCDDVWTFKNWHYNPNQPGGNLYRMVLERVYERAHQEGMHVLLTGYMGDHLYSAGGDWIADLLLDRQFLRAGQELIFQIRNMG